MYTKTTICPALHSTHQLIGRFASALLASSISSAVYANSNQTVAESEIRIEEVFVSAQMRTENLQSVPIAIDVYDEAFIENSGAKTLTELESSIPSLNFGQGGRSTRGEITIRGIGDYSRNVGVSARVAMYVDGVHTGRSYSFDQDLLDVERVEVLNGPQGTLFGSNTLSGAINIITRAPKEDFSLSLISEAGNFDHRSLTAKLNLPLTDGLKSSLFISGTEREGFIDNTTLNEDLNGVNRESAKIKVRYDDIDNLTVDFSVDYREDDTRATNALALSDGQFIGFSSAPDAREVAHNVAEFEKRTLKGAAIQASYITNTGYELISITGARRANFQELNEEDYSPLDVASSLFNEESEQLTQEFRLVSPSDTAFDYVVGTYLFDQDLSTNRQAITGALFPNPNTSTQTPSTAQNRSYSIYTHGNYRINESWALNAGLRYIYEQKEIDFTSIDTTGLAVNVENLKGKISGSEPLPKLGLSYQPQSNIFVYGSIARGYKSGGWNADFLTTLENFEFDSEYSTNYEVGMKVNLFDDRVITNAAAFVTKIKDFQVFQFVQTQSMGTVISLTNAGKVTTQGLELNIKAALNEHLSLTFNTAYTEAKFDEFSDGGGLGVDYDDSYLPFAPKKAYFAALDYERKVLDKGLLYAHLDYGYSGNYFANSDNSAESAIDAYFTANARLGLMINDHWDIYVWGKNITDETNLRQKSTSFLGVPRGYYNPPRTFGLTLKYDT